MAKKKAAKKKPTFNERLAKEAAKRGLTTVKKNSKFSDMHSREIAIHREKQKAKLADVMKVRDFNNS